MTKTILAGGVILLALAGCSNAPDPVAAVDIPGATAAIKTTEANMLAGYKAKDVNKIAAQYAPTATLYIAGQQPLLGATAIGLWDENALKDPNFAIDFNNQATVVAKSGDLAYTKGNYTMAYTNPLTKKLVNEAGNYVTVFQKQPDGSWKAVEDIASANAPH